MRTRPALPLLGLLVLSSACGPKYPGSFAPVTTWTTPAQSLEAAPKSFLERPSKQDYRRWAPSLSFIDEDWDRAEGPREIGDLESGLLMCNLYLGWVASPGVLRHRLPDPHIQVFIGDTEAPLFEDGKLNQRYGFIASAPLVDLRVGDRLRVVGHSNRRPLIIIDETFDGRFPLRAEQGRGNVLECRALTRDEIEESVQPLLRRAWRDLTRVVAGVERRDERFDPLVARLGWADPRVVALRDAYAHALRGELEGWSPP